MSAIASAWQDVQQQALGFGPLDLEFCQGSLARSDEVLEQHVGGRTDVEDVQHEERDDDAFGDVGRAVREGGIDQAREHHQRAEGEKPGHRLPGADEQQGADGTGEGPERHRRGGGESPEAPLQGEGQQQAHQQLAHPEQVKARVRAKV
jgi:hypothetical protein